MVKAILLKPLDGDPEGSEREFDKADFDALAKMGAVRAAVEALRADGPTVTEYVSAGYRAESYPPQGYASRSTAEEIAAAIASQKPPSQPEPEPPAPEPDASQKGEKAAPPVPNKKAPAPLNKGA